VPKVDLADQRCGRGLLGCGRSRCRERLPRSLIPLAPCGVTLWM
jgi:hypothetical protein